jgi:hypothetical protein
MIRFLFYPTISDITKTGFNTCFIIHCIFILRQNNVLNLQIAGSTASRYNAVICRSRDATIGPLARSGPAIPGQRSIALTHWATERQLSSYMTASSCTYTKVMLMLGVRILCIYTGGFGAWCSRQSKRLSPLRGRFSLRTHVKRVSQRSAESRGFSPGAPVSSHRKSWQGGLR